MNRAFLSHSSKQKDFVREVYKLLGKPRCVFDECCFENGKKLIDEIVKGISSSDLFVLFVSNDSLNSKWVQIEISKADNFKNSHPNMILPILIDKNIDPANDIRIPDWMKGHLMNVVNKAHIAANMISDSLRQIEYENNPFFRAKRDIFVGRYHEKEEMESSLNMFIEPHYKVFVMSGLEGIGRRTLLKRFFNENSFLENYKDPICIRLSPRNSIEDLIIKLEEIIKGSITDDDFDRLNSMNMPQKIEELKSIIKDIVNNNIYVFIIDDGCIVRSSLKVRPWFIEATDIPELQGCYNISLISQFKPSSSFLSDNDDFLSIPVGPLKDAETRNLFNSYCRVLGINGTQKMKEILDCLNGIPAQVYYAVERIYRLGIDNAIRNKQSIIDRGDRPVIPIINTIKQRGNDSFNLFILLCTLQTTSYNMIYKIAGDTKLVNDELEYFNVVGIFSLYGSSKQYIDVNTSIADYVKRSRVKLLEKYKQKLDEMVVAFVEKKQKDEEFTDTSVLIHSIQGNIQSGKELPSRYYLPSFTLDAISELYNQEDYHGVIELIDKMLINKYRYDKSTIREYTHWLCLSLARIKSQRFEKEVEYFGEDTEYFFLKGFFYRISHNLNKAEEFLRIALDNNPYHQRAKRELVNVFIMKNNYKEGLQLAEENFNAKNTNPFHIQAYFICLLHNSIGKMTSVIIDELKMLINMMKESLDRKAKSMLALMEGEFAYYIDNNTEKAIIILKNAISTSNRNLFAKKALTNIYYKENRIDELNELNSSPSIDSAD